MWHEEVDLLGTGAGGLAAAVTGAQEGLTTLVLEKTEWLGGTTAAFVAALPGDLTGARALHVGAGAVASAIALALLEAGVEQLRAFGGARLTSH